MSEDSRQLGLDEIVEQNDKSDVSANLHPHIRQLGIEVPDGWRAVSLGEIGQLDTSSVDKKSNSDERRVSLVNYMDVYEKYRINSNIDYMGVTAPESHIERSQVRPGDILFTPSSEEPRDIGNSAVVTEEMERTLHSYHTVRLRPTPDSIQLDIGFSGWLANAPYVAKQFARRATGSTRYTLTLGDFSDTQVLVPPLSEQRKIATVLYTVDRLIEKTEEIVEQTHVVKKALLQEVFHGRHENFEEYQTTTVGEIPAHWSVASIGDVVHTAQYGISESLSEEGQYPIFRMNNIKNGYIIDQPMKYINLDESEFKKYRVKQGDILFNRTNSLELVGKTGIYELEDDHVFASYLVRLQTNSNADSYYLNYYMNSSEAQNRMMDFATKGVSQANINANSIQQVQLPLPPIEEQKEIADRLKSIDSQIEASEQYRSQLERLKRGLMQDLLSGTVRTADTNIEVPEETAQYG